MKKSAIIGIIVVILLALGGVWLVKANNDKKGKEPTSSLTGTSNQSNNSTNNTSNNTDNQNASVIIYTDEGFQPAELTVKAGTTVTVKNNASDSLQFDSDPHPQHTDNVELNVGFIAKGESK